MLGEGECSEETPRDGRRGTSSSCLASRNGVRCASREGIGDEGRTGVAASFFVGSGSLVEAAPEAVIGGGRTGSVSPGIGTGETFPRDEAMDDTGDLGRDMSTLSQYALSNPSAGVPHVGWGLSVVRLARGGGLRCASTCFCSGCKSYGGDGIGNGDCSVGGCAGLDGVELISIGERLLCRGYETSVRKNRAFM
jgi:hypothetical protein